MLSTLFKRLPFLASAKTADIQVKNDLVPETELCDRAITLFSKADLRLVNHIPVDIKKSKDAYFKHSLREGSMQTDFLIGIQVGEIPMFMKLNFPNDTLNHDRKLALTANVQNAVNDLIGQSGKSKVSRAVELAKIITNEDLYVDIITFIPPRLSTVSNYDRATYLGQIKGNLDLNIQDYGANGFRIVIGKGTIGDNQMHISVGEPLLSKVPDKKRLIEDLVSPLLNSIEYLRTSPSNKAKIEVAAQLDAIIARLSESAGPDARIVRKSERADLLDLEKPNSQNIAA